MDLKNLEEACSEVKSTTDESPSQLYLRNIGTEIANQFVEANQGNPQKMAKTRELLRSMAPALIGVILGDAIEVEIREDLRSGWRCLRCGERKDESGKCPVCSQ